MPRESYAERKKRLSAEADARMLAARGESGPQRDEPAPEPALPPAPNGGARRSTFKEQVEARTAERAAAAGRAPASPTPGRDLANAVSVFGLGKLMPLGNIGNAQLRELRRQTELLEQMLGVLQQQSEAVQRQGHLLESLQRQAGPTQAGGDR